MIRGFARDWLASKREELNARTRAARRRWPRLDGDGVLALAAEMLPPLAGRGEDGAAELLDAAWDLILLWSGRGLVSADGGGSRPAMRALYQVAFPAVRTALLAAPRTLPGALANAVERLGPRGEAFVARLAAAGGMLTAPADVEKAGAVIAWRLGEARLRRAALQAADAIPPEAALAALGLDDWPAAGAPLALAALRGDAWRLPEQALSEETLAGAGKLPPGKRAELARALGTPPRAPLGSWVPAGPVGEFAGFGGNFEEPPLLLDPRPQNDRHRFWALTGAGTWRIDADVYGWTCRPDGDGTDMTVRAPKKRGLGALLMGGDDGMPALAPDGTLRFGGEQVCLAAMGGATSFAACADAVAWTVEDSHRIRLLVPRGEPV